MGEDWGKNNYAKAFVAMKDFQMLPLDTSITNTENFFSMLLYFFWVWLIKCYMQRTNNCYQN